MASNWPQIIVADATQNHMVMRGINNATASTFDLSASYSYGASGRALMLMSIFSPETANLTDFWLKVGAYVGTWASTDGNLNWEVREGLNGSRIPGTSQVATGSFSTGGATGWIHVSGLSVALTAGKLYELIIFDSDGGGTNYATIAARYGGQDMFSITAELGTTTGGFGSAWTAINGPPAACVKIGSVYICGQIWDTVSTTTSNQLERGCRFRPKDDCTFIGWGVSTDQLLFLGGHNWKLYADGVIPGGTTLSAMSAVSTTINGAGAAFPNQMFCPAASRVDLSANTWYRCVIDPQSNVNTPRRATAAGSPDATLLAAALPFGGDFYFTTEAAGPVWDDTTDSLPLLGPILVPRSGSAAGGIQKSRNMTGGMSA